jgi:hypothetical protein
MALGKLPNFAQKPSLLSIKPSEETLKTFLSKRVGKDKKKRLNLKKFAEGK